MPKHLFNTAISCLIAFTAVDISRQAKAGCTGTSNSGFYNGTCSGYGYSLNVNGNNGSYNVRGNVNGTPVQGRLNGRNFSGYVDGEYIQCFGNSCY